METIYVTSPKNRFRVKIGEIDNFDREAMFYITQSRHFIEANAIGIDADVFKRKSVQWCKKIIFKMWDGNYYRILIEDFREHCWLYPPKDSPDYKANREVFKPKLVMLMEKIKKFDKKTRKQEKENKKEDEERILKIAVS